MNRDFSRFLEAYCRELAGERTSSVRKLSALACGDRPRLKEPLLLYCVARGKERHLLEVVPDASVAQEYRRVLIEMAGLPSMESYLSSDMVPKRYGAVLDAFKAQGADERESGLRIKELLRKKTLAALEERGATRYALCKALGLNTGNVYTYLTGDPSKVSLQTARRIYECAQAL